MMDRWMLALAIFLFAAAVVTAAWTYAARRRELKRLTEMLDAATDGSFRERSYDETMLSRLEMRMADYLSQNETQMQMRTKEKDAVKTLISDISHQTKTPIANLRLYTELLMEQEADNRKNADTVREIVRQTEKLETLIGTLVKLSRLENGIVAVRPEKNELCELLSDIDRDFRPRAEEKGLEFIVEQTAVTAAYDAGWTLEAVANIVDNAVKYTDSGHVRISVREFEMFVCIDVEDTGRGIPESEQAEIFGRFYRGRNAVRADGLGIGLFLARQIIGSQGGYIKVASAGEGSTFSVFLPVKLNV